MENSNLCLQFTVSHPPATVFAAICEVKRWWGAGIEGTSGRVGNEFFYRNRQFHTSTQRVTQLVNHSKVVWHVTSAELSFIKDKNEWTGTDIVFDITNQGGQTLVSLTHVGLTPQVECYGACLEGWSHYFTGSLKQLIESGTGSPDPEDYSKNSG